MSGIQLTTGLKTWYLTVGARRASSLGTFSPVGITVLASDRAGAEAAAIAEFNSAGHEVEHVLSVKETSL